MTHRHLITDAATAATFITAGKAFFTLANVESEVHATYRVEAVKGEDDTFTVALFTGTENTDRSAYKVIGFITHGVWACALRNELTVLRDLLGAAENAGDDWLAGFCKSLIGRVGNGREFTSNQEAALARNLNSHGIKRATQVTDEQGRKVAGFGWVKTLTEQGREFPTKVQFWTEGRCCTCGRRLTNPKSIDALEGPVCSSRRGLDLTGTVLDITPTKEA